MYSHLVIAIQIFFLDDVCSDPIFVYISNLKFIHKPNV